MPTARLLLLNQYYPPDTAATAKWARALAAVLAERFQVTVLAGRPSYDPGETHGPYLWRRFLDGAVSVLRVGSTAMSRHRVARRLANYATYLALATLRALMLPCDAVLAMTDPPVAGIIGALVARAKGVPFLYNIQDLYPDLALGTDLLPPSRWVRAWERLHRWALRQAAVIIVLGEDMRERVIAKGVIPGRVMVVRHGAPLSDALPPRDHPITAAIRDGCPFVVLHAGNLGVAGAWETLVRAAAELEADGIGLLFVGDGSSRRALERLAAGRRTVRFLPFRPEADIPYVLAAGDLHVVSVRRGLEGVVVPSKLYGILAAGRPVLAVTPEESEVARIVRQHGCGFVADPDDAQTVVRAVREAAADPHRLAEMGRAARHAAHAFNDQQQLRRFSEIVGSVVAGGAPRHPRVASDRPGTARDGADGSDGGVK